MKDNTLKQKFKYNISVAEYISLLKDLLQEDLISDYISVKPIDQVALFQRIFGDEVNDLGTIPSIDKRKLRLKLIFEELSELAEAYGLEGSFYELWKNYCLNHLVKSKIGDYVKVDEPIDTNEYNPTEALDATCDLLVVVYGGACINGHSSIIDEAFDETMRSNMSKSCDTLDEAQYSVAEYHKEGRDTYHKVVEDKYVIYDSNTNKILKNRAKFFKPDYSKLLNGE